MQKEKTIYAILREIQLGNEPTADDYDLHPVEFANIVNFMKEEGFINKASVAAGRIVWLENAKVTEAGIEYLAQNSKA